MSTRYNTGNPIESTDVRDMSDNAKNLDLFSNSSELSFDDRFGVERKTIHGMNSEFDGMIVGMNSEFDAQILNMGFTRVGTFLSGATLTNPRQTLLWDIADGGDGQEYGWSGTFAPHGKIVPPSSSPTSTGGVAIGAWVSRFDPLAKTQIREALRRSYAEAGYNLVDGSFEVGGTLVNVNDVLLYETDGTVYVWLGILPKSVPAGSSPATTGGIVPAGWLDVGDASIRGELSSDNGLSLIGRVDNISGLASLSSAEGRVVSVVSAVGGYGATTLGPIGGGSFRFTTKPLVVDGWMVVQGAGGVWVRELNQPDLMLEWFGCRSDSTDNTAGLQASIKFAGAGYRDDAYSNATRKGPRRVGCLGGSYSVLGGVIIPQGVIVDLDNAEIVGGGSNTIFISGGFKVDGSLESNIALPDNTYRIVASQIRNIKFRNCVGYNVKNFAEQSVIEFLTFTDCPQCGVADSSWYGSFRHMTSRNPTAPKTHALPAFVFSTYVNSENIHHINVTQRLLAYQFDGAVNGQRLEFVNAEGCTNGLLFTGEVKPIQIYGYYEDITDVAINMGAAQSHEGIVISGFFNNVGTAFYGNQIVSGDIFRGAHFINVGVKYNTDDHVTSAAKIVIPPDAASANSLPAIPSGWNPGDTNRVDHYHISRADDGLPTAKQNFTGGMVELPFSGRETRTVENIIPFCQQRVAGTSKLSIQTAIQWDIHMTVLLNLTLNGNRIRGRLYSDLVILDIPPANIMVTPVNSGGYLAIDITGAAMPATPPFATGVVRIA